MRIKEKIGEKKLNVCADMLRVIAHPVRMEIVQLLDEHKELNVSGLQNRLGIAQPVASLHLKSLKDKGLLKSRRDGASVWYALTYPRIVDVVRCVENCANKLNV